MSRARTADEIVIGGEPRVDLLPPIVRARKKSKTQRKFLGAAVLAVVMLMGGGVVAASLQATQSDTELSAAQQRTTDLLAEQMKYSELRQLRKEVDAAGAARQVGASTEVDWKTYFDGIRAQLPADVTIDTISVDSESPLTPYQQPTVPLQAERVATLVIGLTSPSLPTVPEWLKAMKSLPGYADGTPGSITRSDTGAYLVNLTLHINKGAYSNRFADAASTEGK